MFGKVHVWPMTAVVAGLLAIGPAAAAATMGPIPSPPPIGPNQYFSGLVNGSDGITSPAIIKTDCIGPVTPGQTGHPTAGQTVEVVLAQPTGAGGDLGYTGNANSIAAALAWPWPSATTAPAPVATFSSYNVAEPISTKLIVPCGGQGGMLFIPGSAISSGSANPPGRTATVVVTFEGQP